VRDDGAAEAAGGVENDCELRGLGEVRFGAALVSERRRSDIGTGIGLAHHIGRPVVRRCTAAPAEIVQ